MTSRRTPQPCHPGPQPDGQPVYAPYFWEQAKNGLADCRRGKVYIFDITSSDISKYPDLGRYEIVKIYEDSNGFVTCEPDFED